MLKKTAYKFRLYPTKTQIEQINRTFGCGRFYWNSMVELFNSYSVDNKPKQPTYTEFRHQHDFMLEVSAVSINYQERAFEQFKKQYFSKTRKVKVNRPNFKSRKGSQSFKLDARFKIKDGKIRIEKVGWIKMEVSRQIPDDARFINVTVSRNCSGQYFASILVEREVKELPKTGKSVGIDVGLKSFLVQSDGVVIENPRYFRESQAKIATVQRFMSRKVKGSNRWHKNRLRVARIHQHITNQRDYFLHTESTRIVKEYDFIGVEDLDVAGMLKKRNLAKSISDASWSKFNLMLAYKAEWYGKTLVKVDRFYPSSKTCSKCGSINKEQTLSDRVYECKCGHVMDRDLNASINIKNKALEIDSAQRTQSVNVSSRDEAFN